MQWTKNRWNDGNMDRNDEPVRRARAQRQERIAAPSEQVAERLERLFDDLGRRWLVTHWGEGSDGYGAVLVDPGFAIGKLESALSPDQGSTRATLAFVYTALSSAENRLFDETLDQRIDGLLERIAAALRGESLPATELQLSSAEGADGDAFEPARVSSEHEVVVSADPDACFALACPVAELDWIDDWHFDLIHADSGRNEDDCIFLEPSSAMVVHRTVGAGTHWYTTLYEPDSRRFHAVLLTADLTVARWTLEVDDLGEGQSRFRWGLTYVGLGDRGNRLLAEQGFADRVLLMQRFLASSAKHYLETGRILRVPRHRKAEVALALLGASIARHVRRPFGLRAR